MTETAEEKMIDDNEAQLLAAMSINDVTELPVYKAYAGKEKSGISKKAEMNDIIESLKTVYDPELPINIYDLGLIYEIKQEDNGNLHIDMSLTAPGCPVAEILPQQVADAAAMVEGIGKVEVEVVWEPAWSLDRLSEEARLMLEMM